MKPIAIVTGAASGLGREFVRVLDNVGFVEIWAIDSDAEQLKTLQTECRTKIVPLVWDLTKDETYITLRNLLWQEQPKIDWLVCCAGIGKFGRVDEIDIHDTGLMIDLNCRAYNLLTETAIPFMQKGSRIVHVASMAGFQPVPYMATYAATKAFTISYARALHQEMKPKGISVTCVCPYWTKTSFLEKAAQTQAKEQAVSTYPVMYKPESIVLKAFTDASKGKEISIYGAKAKRQACLVKFLSHKSVMKKWMKQQGLDKKYGNK